MKTELKLTYLAAIIIAFAIAACSTTTGGRRDRIVPESKRNELRVGGPYKSAWETRDLTINYEYTFNSGRLMMSGEIKLRREKNLDSFNLIANLIDETGRVLQAQRIAWAGGRRRVDVIPFESEVNAPEGTWGVAFSYSGTVRGTGQDAGSPKSFWHTAF